MFTTPKTSQEFFKPLTDFYAVIPKTPEAMFTTLKKVQTIFSIEYENSQTAMNTYQQAMFGNATPGEVTEANKKAIELMKTAALIGLVSIPGTVFILPAIIEKAKEYNISLVPESVAEQFDI